MCGLLPLSGRRALGVGVARCAKPATSTVPGNHWQVLTVALRALVLELMPASTAVLVASIYAGRTPNPMIITESTLILPARVVRIVNGLFGGWRTPRDSVAQPVGATLTPETQIGRAHV